MARHTAPVLLRAHTGNAQGVLVGHSDPFAMRKAYHAQGLWQIQLPLKCLQVQLKGQGQPRWQL